MLVDMIIELVDFLSVGGWIPVSVVALIALAYSLTDAAGGITTHAYNKTRPR